MHPSILVVDDSQLYRATFCQLLQLCWPTAQIAEAADASQALTLFAEHPWDLLIFDYQLPTLSGTDLARHLRTQAHAQGRVLPPIILMSTQPDAAIFARASGATAFLPKPVDAAMLHAALAPLLSVPALPQVTPSVPTLPRCSAAPLPQCTVPVSTGLAQLRARIQHEVDQTLHRYPPPHASFIADIPPGSARRVGDALVQRGYLTRWQLICTLQTNRSLPSHTRVPLGFTMVAQHGVPAAVLSAVLLQQFCDRLVAAPATAPRFIGEHMLLHAELTPAQLARALQDQLEGYQQGRWVRLGELLTRHGWRASAPINAGMSGQLQHD
ncbi:MAG: response regulator [Roseiflexaceae bacterium]